MACRVSVAPSDTWFCTKINSEASSMKMVPPTYLSVSGSFPYVCGNQPLRLETNWSVDIIAPTVRLCFLRLPSFLGQIV